LEKKKKKTMTMVNWSLVKGCDERRGEERRG
jgi:hypothetical protein